MGERKKNKEEGNDLEGNWKRRKNKNKWKIRKVKDGRKKGRYKMG